MGKDHIDIVELQASQAFLGSLNNACTRDQQARKLGKGYYRSLLPRQPSIVGNFLSQPPEQLGGDDKICSPQPELFDHATPGCTSASASSELRSTCTHISSSDLPPEYSSAVSNMLIPWSKAVLMIS